jgi:hypothetical protein
MERSAVNTWWQHRQSGDDVLLMAPTNETVAVLIERCQQRRIRAGEIDPNSRHTEIADGQVFVGDEIATRHNDRQLRTDHGEMVRNRATWTIEHIGSDGSIVAIGRNGTVRLPANYVAEYVELAYATTGMGAQGRTVETGILYLDSSTDVRNIYVPMTRGRDHNVAFVATTGEDTAVDVLSRCLTTDWIDQPAHTRQAELGGASVAPPSLLTGEQLRDLFADQYELNQLVNDGNANQGDNADLDHVEQTIWNDIHVRAHHLRLEQPDWAIDELGPIPDHANGRRVWGIFAARIEQHHHAYNEVIDHQGAYHAMCEIVDKIRGQPYPVVQRSRHAIGVGVEL